MEPSREVFISYSRKDARFVNKLVADLADHQVTAWSDSLEIEPGDQHRQKIESAIQACEYFCLVISPASLASYYVRKLELEAAFARMIQTGREAFILPVMRKQPEKALPLMLSTFHYLDCTTSMKYKARLKRLVKRIKHTDEHFTGIRLYKNVDTSFSGHYGGGRTYQANSTPWYVCVAAL